MWIAVNFLIVTIFILVSNSIFGQTNRDSCTSHKSAKVIIENADANSVQLSVLNKGFTLIPNDSILKITGFHFAFSGQEVKGKDFYLISSFEGNKFDPEKYPEFTKQLDYAKTIYIDNIFAIRRDSCYRIRPISYSIK